MNVSTMFVYFQYNFSILEVICQNLRLAPDFNYEKIAACTPGFVGADLQALVREAAIYAVDW